MKTIEIKIKNETFKVIPTEGDGFIFSVFNHTTFHIIKKNDFGIWTTVEHRFGAETLPIDEIGEAIDNYYTSRPQMYQ
ncbi:hypothetical protein [Mucilaginibacter sp.]|uniref:hypothetical protein n=1 Tax=Mucilaginibacter sp. TaxID=1882438 RepID=UPI003D0B8148